LKYYFDYITNTFNVMHSKNVIIYIMKLGKIEEDQLNDLNERTEAELVERKQKSED